MYFRQPMVSKIKRILSYSVCNIALRTDHKRPVNQSTNKMNFSSLRAQSLILLSPSSILNFLLPYSLLMEKKQTIFLFFRHLVRKARNRIYDFGIQKTFFHLPVHARKFFFPVKTPDQRELSSLLYDSV